MRRDRGAVSHMDVRPADVKRYGSTAAIVLSHLREIGAQPGVPVLIGQSSLGRAVGLERRAVSRALEALHGARRIGRRASRHGGRYVVWLRDVGSETTGADKGAQGQLTQQDGVGLPQSDPQHLGDVPPPTTISSGTATRLDTVRALLDAAG